jgi:hypothetical protein
LIWSDAQKERLTHAVVKQVNEQTADLSKMLKGQALWERMSNILMVSYNIPRSANSCKMIWHRELRAMAGVEERVRTIPRLGLVSGVEGTHFQKPESDSVQIGNSKLTLESRVTMQMIEDEPNGIDINNEDDQPNAVVGLDSELSPRLTKQNSPG